MAILPIRKIVVTSALSALVIVLGFTRTGFIPWFAGAAITILHVPVILAAVLEGPIVGLIVGFMFGTQSLLQAMLSPTGPLDPLFTNPLISVLPRLFIGPVAGLVFALIAKKKKHVGLEFAGASAAAILGTLTNTALVLFALFAFAREQVAALMPDVRAVGALILANALPEGIAALVFTLAFLGAWKGLSKGLAGSRLKYHFVEDGEQED